MEASRSKPKAWTNEWMNKTAIGQVVRGVAVAILISILIAAGQYLVVIPGNAQKGEQALKEVRSLQHKYDSVCTRQAIFETRQTALENKVSEQVGEVKEDIADIKRMVDKLLDIELRRQK